MRFAPPRYLPIALTLNGGLGSVAAQDAEATNHESMAASGGQVFGGA
ncbi:MAG: hypothetical protein ABGZ35_24810 [Planctomycetaceae bacterium]